VESDLIVLYLEHLRHRIMKYHNEPSQLQVWPFVIPVPPLQEDCTIHFKCFAIDLHLTFKELLRGLTPAYQFRDARQLGKRLSDGREVFKQAGWTVTDKQRRKGRAYWDFVYEPLAQAEDEDGFDDQMKTSGATSSSDFCLTNKDLPDKK
jgi:hypothetical protein